MNPATARASRVPKHPVLADTAVLASAAITIDPRLPALSDDGLRRRWERLAQGDRA